MLCSVGVYHHIFTRTRIQWKMKNSYYYSLLLLLFILFCGDFFFSVMHLVNNNCFSSANTHKYTVNAAVKAVN